MSKRVGAHIKCPSCGTETEFHLYRSLWIEDPENRKMVFEDRVNLFECPSCGRSERAQFPFLCTNTKLGFAVWYEPYHDEAIDQDVEEYKKHMGPNSFYATAPRIKDWEEFKKKIIEFENGESKGQRGVELSDEMAGAFTDFQDKVVAKEKPIAAQPKAKRRGMFIRKRDYDLSNPPPPPTTLLELVLQGEQGDPKAQLELGERYSSGSSGATKDMAEAAKWYRKAAVQGDGTAQQMLGFMYFKGEGVPQDFSEAKRWLTNAAEQGNTAAKDDTDTIQERSVSSDEKKLSTGEKDRETVIRSMVEDLNQQGNSIPTKLSEIEDFPYSDFNTLIDDIKSGDANVLRFAYEMDQSLFSILASTIKKLKLNLGLFIAYGGTLAAVVLSFVYSFWLLATMPIFYFVGTNLTKRAYNSAIFEGAFNSETIFSFLYFYGQISVQIPKQDKQFFHKKD